MKFVVGLCTYTVYETHTQNVVHNIIILLTLNIAHPAILVMMMMVMMMMMMMIMNCSCGMVDQWKAFSLIFNRDHCQRSSPCWISDTPQAAFEPAQSLSSRFAKWRCAASFPKYCHLTSHTFITRSSSNLTLIRLGFLKVVFLGRGRGEGGSIWPPPSYFKTNLSNFNITLYSC